MVPARIQSTAAARSGTTTGAAATSVALVRDVGMSTPIAPALCAAATSDPMSPTTTH